MKIKKGDKVKVISGKDRGKEGTVLSVIRNDRKVIVSGINMVTLFEKKKAEDKKGGLKKIEGPINVSKLMVVNPDNSKPSRVGFKVEDDKKVRIFKNSSKK